MVKTSLSPKDLLYPRSPFTATIVDDNISSIYYLIKLNRVSPLHAVCHELCLIADSLNRSHDIFFEEINKNFGTKKFDLTLFFFGFTTIPTITIAACHMEVEDAEMVIKNLTQRSQNPHHILLNQYKVNRLYPINSITSSHNISKPKTALETIYQRLLNNPYSNDLYYLAGVESSYQAALKLSQKIEDRLVSLK